MGPLLYLNTDEYQTLAYGLFSFKTSFGYKFPHYMMAASTMMMIPTLVVFLLAPKAFLRGVVVTGVKG
jgi:multiple sugar transport system permease protein